jgi:2-(1,2-epoxy-1,2-dihydrophenyl)acetyl-CoA isomerase
MSFQTILFGADQGVARIRLNRPERLNAANALMLTELNEAFAAAESDPEVRAVVLSAEGRAFCAGQDLAEEEVVGGEAPGQAIAGTLDRNYHPLLRRIRALPKPVLAEVGGIAAGGGCGLALACDIVLAGESASFLQAFGRIGLIPDCGSTWILPRLIGEARARAMMLTAEPVDARRAESWGMIHRCLPDAELSGEVEKLAARLAQGPTAAYARTKLALAESFGRGYAAQLDLERDLQREAADTADFREGLAAFAAKRAPRFNGR